MAIGGLIRLLFTAFLNSGAPRAIQREVIKKVSNSETMQRMVLSTNKALDENKKKVMKKIQESETYGAVAERGSISNFLKEFGKLYKEEAKKEFENIKKSFPKKE